MPDPEQGPNTLPKEIWELGERLGAKADMAAVTLTQSGTMQDHPGARPMHFSARQVINLRRPEFDWRATTCPLGCVSVRDALKDQEADLEVRLLRLVKLAAVHGGAALAKGEIMRYLAELAWAPDAILSNQAIIWNVIDRETIRGSAGQGPARGEVELHLDESGRIASVTAGDRPRKEGTGFVERPWRGRFFDYRRHKGRWLPFVGEAEWILNGESFIAFRGQILSWSIG
jgi:hypothetical protein